MSGADETTEQARARIDRFLDDHFDCDVMAFAVVAVKHDVEGLALEIPYISSATPGMANRVDLADHVRTLLLGDDQSKEA